MERAVALKKLGKLLGKSLGYRVDPKAPDADGRAEAAAELKVASAERNEAQQRMDERRKAILEGDVEYQVYKSAYEAARKRTGELSYRSNHYRFTAGVSTGMFFVVKAQGDSWEEVIAKVKAAASR